MGTEMASLIHGLLSETVLPAYSVLWSLATQMTVFSLALSFSPPQPPGKLIPAGPLAFLSGA